MRRQKMRRLQQRYPQSFRIELKECGLRKDVDVVRMGCSDNCKHAPVISIQPKNAWLGEVEEKQVARIVKDYFL